jgi:hypothetical protein
MSSSNGPQESQSIGDWQLWWLYFGDLRWFLGMGIIFLLGCGSLALGLIGLPPSRHWLAFIISDHLARMVFGAIGAFFIIVSVILAIQEPRACWRKVALIRRGTPRLGSITLVSRTSKMNRTSEVSLYFTFTDALGQIKNGSFSAQSRAQVERLEGWNQGDPILILIDPEDLSYEADVFSVRADDLERLLSPTN